MGWQKKGEAEYVEPPCLEEQFGTVYLKVSLLRVFRHHLEWWGEQTKPQPCRVHLCEQRKTVATPEEILGHET